MPKYRVDLSKTVYKSATVEVEAENREEARDLAWDHVKSDDWYSKTADSDTYVQEVKE